MKRLIALAVIGLLATALGMGLLAGKANASSVIFYTDTTGKPWPVPTTARAWNANGDVYLVRVKSCIGYTPCYDIMRGDPGTTRDGSTVMGMTWRSSLGGMVILNTAYEYLPWRDRRQAVCHELGHVLGLDDDIQDQTCVMSIDGLTPWPTPADLDRVRALW